MRRAALTGLAFVLAASCARPRRAGESCALGERCERGADCLQVDPEVDRGETLAGVCYRRCGAGECPPTQVCRRVSGAAHCVAPARLGETCVDDFQCDPGDRCWGELAGSGGGPRRRICYRTCDADGGCPAGSRCQVHPYGAPVSLCAATR